MWFSYDCVAFHLWLIVSQGKISQVAVHPLWGVLPIKERELCQVVGTVQTASDQARPSRGRSGRHRRNQAGVVSVVKADPNGCCSSARRFSASTAGKTSPSAISRAGIPWFHRWRCFLSWWVVFKQSEPHVIEVVQHTGFTP